MNVCGGRKVCRIAAISLHSCPLADLGERQAGGMNVYVREISRELGRRGMEVDIFTRLTDPGIPRIVEYADNARVIHLPAGPPEHIDKNEIADHLPEFICGVLRFAAEDDVDYKFIYSHYWLSGWAGVHLARRWRVPHLTMFHTLARVKNQARPSIGESEKRARVEERVMSRADAIVVSSEHEGLLMSELYGATRNKIRVIAGGVNPGLFQPLGRAAARRAVGLNGGKIALFVGRFDPIKGLDLLLRAMQRTIVPRDTQLVVVGGPSVAGESEKARRLVRELGLADRVKFAGLVKQESLHYYYSAADVTVIPSYYESFGLVALESMACGTPVLAACTGGLTSIVSDGENGLLFQLRQPDALAGKLEQILADPLLWQRLAVGASATPSRFSWGTTAERVLALTRELGEQASPQQLCKNGHFSAV